MHMNCLLMWIEAHQGLASWVQAVFTMIAIPFTYWMASRQFASAKELEADKRIQELELRRQLINALVNRIHDAVLTLHVGLATNDFGRVAKFDPNLLDHYKTSLAAIPFMEIPYLGLAVALADLPRAISDLIDVFQTAKKYTQPDDYVSFIEHFLAADGEEKLKRVMVLAGTSIAQSNELQPF